MLIFEIAWGIILAWLAAWLCYGVLAWLCSPGNDDVFGFKARASQRKYAAYRKAHPVPQKSIDDELFASWKTSIDDELFSNWMKSRQ